MFCTAYLNDILIYSDNKKKHNEHIYLILIYLQEFRLYVNIEKYVFKTWEVLYLSLFIRVNDICINLQKIVTITDWFTFIKLKQFQSFLGFINFYHHFIVNFFKIYDKEQLIIVKAFKKWHFKIYGTADPVIILTDYKNLKYFTITHKLNHHQAHWNEFLSEFNFNIIYWSEVINSVADVLIYYAGNSFCNEKNLQNAHQYQTILEGQQLQLNIFNVYESDTVNAITVVSIILWNQKHNFQLTV